MRFRRLTLRRLVSVVGVVALAGTAGLVARAATAATTASAFNYAEALQKAVWFYDAQREGKLPADNRVPWRGDSFLSDGKDAGLDLVGGFADAGDTIKATYPLSHALGALAWSAVEWPSGYSKTGQDKYLLSNLRWGMDYLIKANPSPTKLVTEVGDPNLDHKLWAAAEVQTYSRQTYTMNAASCWGADLADSTAATFAAASMVFKATDPTYAATLLTHAKQLYATTESAKKVTYDTCTPVISSFYKSWSGYYDELVWGSLWLYRATGDASYLDRAKAYYQDMPKNGQSPTDPIKFSWTYDWDDKTAASYILMAALTGDEQATADATKWADFNAGAGVDGAKVKTSPGGQAFYGDWGSLRYSAGAAMLAFVLGDSGRLDSTRSQKLHDFAAKQINYILGDNPAKTSYMVGFGPKFIKRPHHRTAHGSGTDSFSDPVENRHTIYGALVGGPPAADDKYGEEDRNAYQKSEVALDYNAGMTGALARLAQEYGGTPLASLADDPKDAEMYMTASLNQASSNFVELRTVWYNRTAWPARSTPNVSFRYYFTLESGMSASAVKLQTAYAQCKDPTGPTLASGNTYYVTVSCDGQDVTPTGQGQSRRENQFRITFPAAHDYAKDFSYQGVAATQSTPAVVQNIPMFDGTTLVAGKVPGDQPSSPASPSISVPPSSPVASPSVSVPPSSPVASPSRPVPPSSSIASPSRQAGGCKVTLTTNSWSTGYTAAISVVNNGTAAVSNWALSFTLPSGQSVTGAWSASVTPTSGAVTAKAPAWSSTLQPGAAAEFGYQATYSGTLVKPSGFSLNGTACTVA